MVQEHEESPKMQRFIFEIVITRVICYVSMFYENKSPISYFTCHIGNSSHAFILAGNALDIGGDISSHNKCWQYYFLGENHDTTYMDWNEKSIQLNSAK